MNLRALMMVAASSWAAVSLAGCSDDASDGGGGDDFAAGPEVAMPEGPATAPGDQAAAVAAENAAAGEASAPAPAGAAMPAAACKKRLKVLFTVGVPGLSKFKSNGCWTPIIADGAATPTFRKCSTGSFAVQNANAPNWAYDDTNPQHSLSQEKTFLFACAAGATGDGYEYMAYRGGWRLLGAPRLRAYFAELYGSATTDIDSLWYVTGAYRTNAGLKNRTDVFPMINFGTPKASKLEAKVHADALTICKTIADGGYYGMYNASWREGMAATDPRLLALEAALDECTAK